MATLIQCEASPLLTLQIDNTLLLFLVHMHAVRGQQADTLCVT